MSLVELKDKRIDWLVDYILPSKELYELNPIIAGGSMLSVYRAIKLFDTEAKWEEFKSSAERKKLFKSQSSLVNKMDSFGDIDMWIDDPGSSLLSDDHSILKPCLKKYNLTSIRRSSVWANTFNTSSGGHPLQIIKSSAKSVKAVLAKFDLINCCVAYNDKTLYVDHRLDKAFSDLILRSNNPHQIKSDNISMRIFSALRAFKYSNRFGLDFSDEVSELIFKVYYDTKDIGSMADCDSTRVSAPFLYPYGASELKRETILSMLEALRDNFYVFSKMKSFRKEYAIYLIDACDYFSNLQKVLQEYGVKESSAVELPF